MDFFLKISLIQPELKWLEIDKNLEFYTREISISNADLIILPEMFDTGFVTNEHTVLKLERKKTFHWLKIMTAMYGKSIAGSLIVKTDNGYKNRFILMLPDGSYEFYDKRHLFALAGEDKVFSCGNERKIIDFKGWKIKPQICYDLRFPVWARNAENYHLLIYVANWPLSRINQWKTLLTARAIENQCYVVGVNTIGTDGNGFVYGGKSMVIDFKGEIIYEAPENQTITKELTFDFNALSKARTNFPFLKDKDKFKML
jgi:predicted amidohydrolase